MYTISKEFAFSAAHHLPHLPEGHPCRRPHGHNYRVVVVLAADVLDKRDFVMDYGDLAPLKNYIDSRLDHQDLNQVFPFPTTAENLAFHLFSICFLWWPDQVVEVRVSETDKTWATYSLPSGDRP